MAPIKIIPTLPKYKHSHVKTNFLTLRLIILSYKRNCLIFPTLSNARIGFKNLKNFPNDTTVRLSNWQHGGAVYVW